MGKNPLEEAVKNAKRRNREAIKRRETLKKEGREEHPYYREGPTIHVWGKGSYTLTHSGGPRMISEKPLVREKLLSRITETEVCLSNALESIGNKYSHFHKTYLHFLNVALKIIKKNRTPENDALFAIAEQEYVRLEQIFDATEKPAKYMALALRNIGRTYPTLFDYINRDRRK